MVDVQGQLVGGVLAHDVNMPGYDREPVYLAFINRVQRLVKAPIEIRRLSRVVGLRLGVVQLEQELGVAPSVPPDDREGVVRGLRRRQREEDLRRRPLQPPGGAG